MLNQLDDYDWAEVFGEGWGGNCTPIIPNPQPFGAKISTKTFSREDVSTIIQSEVGENDGPDWIIYGTLNDGRYFAARGGCDYTGWDCQASNSGDVAETIADLIRFALSDDERKRFNLNLEDYPSIASFKGITINQ